MIDAHRSGRKQKLSNFIKKNLRKLSTPHGKKSRSTCRRGRRRLSTNILKKRTRWVFSPELSTVAERRGLRYQKPHRAATKADKAEHGEFYDKLKINGDGRHNNLYRRNQEIYPSWTAFRAQTMLPSVEFSEQCDWNIYWVRLWKRRVLLLSIQRVRHRERANHFIFQLYNEFKDDWLLSWTERCTFRCRCSRNWRLAATSPSSHSMYSPELNPVE